MTTCPKCSKELSDGAKFCDGCGAQILKQFFALIAGSRQVTSVISARAVVLL